MSSVLSQDWPDLEYLVVDPGSTDHTSEIIQSFQRRYPGRVIHIDQPDAGPSDGLNKGFARATGQLFGYLNADDFYLPGCLKKAVDAARMFPNAAAVYADGYTASGEGKILRRVISTRFTPRKFAYGGALVLQQSTFYRAENFREVGGFNVENRTSWDAEILLDMALQSMQLVHVPGFWSVFRIHSQSITGSQRLAEESRSTHARYFRKVMGRDRTSLDRLAAKFVMAYTLLSEPRSLAARIGDRLWNSGAKAPAIDLENTTAAF